MNFPKTANDLYGIICELSKNEFNLRRVYPGDISAALIIGEREFDKINWIQKQIRELETNGFIVKSGGGYKPLTDPIDVVRMKKINGILENDKQKSKAARKFSV